MSRLLRQSRHVLTAFIGLAGLCVAPSTAIAEPGDHIQLGNATEFAPDVDLGFQYRSNINQANPGQSTDNNPLNDRQDGVAFTVAPGARLTYETPDTLVQLTGDYRLIKYFTQTLSRADQFNDFDINFRGDFARTGPVGFYLRERPVLVNNNADAFGNTPFHTRFRNEAAAGLSLRPGAILQMNVGGAFEFDNIQVPPGSAGAGDVRALNQRIGGGADWDLRYLFLPRTAIVVEGDWRYYDWQRNWVEGPNNPGVAIPDAQQFRLLGGLRGRVTDRIVLVAQLGYGASPYNEQSVTDVCSPGVNCDPDGAANPFGRDLRGLERLLAVLQVQYTLDEGRDLTIAYRKDFDDVFFTNYMAYNSILASFRTPIGTRMRARAEVAVRQEGYFGEVVRNDLFLNVRGDVTYTLQDWASITGAVIYQSRNSNVSTAEFFDVQPRIFATFTY